jgi:hypothetical protein
MKARIYTLSYSLCTLAMLIETLGAGRKWR